ncbi:MAG: hypothetical protein AAF376_01675 [Pseudomonadota bacterium]
MSAFLRPDAARLLHRWREVIIAIAVIALGLWISLRPGPIVQGFGYVLIAVGAFGLIPAIRRARFAADGQGPGVVRVDEGRVLYMGPVTGGAIAIREMTSLSLRRDADGQAHWVLSEPGALLTIPVNADGAEALFDAFTALDGLSAPHLLRALESTAPGSQRLWSRDRDPALPRP